MTAMRVKRMRNVWQVLGALVVEVAQGDCPMDGCRDQVAESATLQRELPTAHAMDGARRSWPVRLARKCLGVVGALRTAWAICRTPMRPDAAASAPRSRPGRDALDVSGGQLSEG